MIWAVTETKTSMCYQVLPTLSSVTLRRSVRRKQMKPKPAQNAETSSCWCVTLRRFMAPLRSRRVSLNPLPVLSPPPANVAPLPPTWVDAPQTQTFQELSTVTLYIWRVTMNIGIGVLNKKKCHQGFTNVQVFIFTWPFLSSNRALSTSFDVWMLCKI